MTVLLTGGTGYIGSHTAVELLNCGIDVVIADNLYNSDESVVSRIEEITKKPVIFYHSDMTNRVAVQKIFENHHIDAIIHFAGYKAVGESVSEPIKYYRNNIDLTLTLLEVIQDYNCSQFVFSSSATVYGTSDNVPFEETMTDLRCINPYGWTKLMNEQILHDAAIANPNLSVVLLRYFNPIGAHESGLIGEKPNGIPNNLIPYITQVAVGTRERLSVFGNDYPTPDGTGVRDYIHVVDLAKGHVAALNYCMHHIGCEVFNLGTGTGYSVLDIVKTFEQVNNIHIPYTIAPRRPGDIASCYADTRKAKEMLGWKAEKTIEDMCRDAWRWQQNVDKME